jgi:hypothetical protein
VVVSWDRFAFVATAHMSDRVRPASLTLRSETVFRATASVGAVTHETRNIGGRSENVVINKGPGVAEFQKASGHETKPITVQEAHSRTRFPDSMMHGTPGVHPAPTINGGDHRGPEAEPHHGEPPHPAEGHRGKDDKHD